MDMLKRTAIVAATFPIYAAEAMKIIKQKKADEMVAIVPTNYGYGSVILPHQSVKNIAQRIRMSYRQNVLASASDATMVLYVGAGG